MTLYLITIVSYILYFTDNILREGIRWKNKTPRLSSSVHDKYSSIFTTVFLCLVPILPVVSITGFGSIENTILRIVGIFIQVLALIIRFVSLRELRHMYTGNLTIVQNHYVVKSGIYSHIRHPGYLSVLIQSIGFGLAIGNIICVGIIAILYVLVYSYRIKVEEQMLVEHFGQEYLDYTSSTYKLIPSLW